MKPGPAAGALSLCLFMAAFVVQVSAPTAVHPPVAPQGGAWKAFEWWYAQRASPNAFIPPRALRNAHDERRQIQSVKGHRGDGVSSDTAAWESIGPDNIGGRVLAIAVHPYETNTVFAGSASGGLWKSVSAGEGVSPWSYVPTGYPALSISAIAIDAMHPDTIYIGTGEISRYFRPLVGTLGARSSYGMGILRSTDGGSTWDTTGLSWAFQNITAVQKIVINPMNPSTLFAATSEGVYRSIDAGDSWTVSNSELMAMDLVINPTDTTILISSHGNLNSTANPGLYMTFDGGGIWSKLEGGLPTSNFGRTSLSISPSDPSVVYAGITDGTNSRIIGLYKSSDGGLTWTQMSTTNYVGSQGWYDNVVAVHPSDPATLYAAGFDIHKSSTSGASLPAISSGSVHVDHHAIAFDPSDPQTVYFGSDGGMYKTTNSGTTFINLNKGFVTTQFYPGFANAADDSTIALGGLQDNGTLRYNGTGTWTPVWGGDGGWCAIDQTDNNTMYAETQYGRIVRSYSGGGSFSGVTLGLPGSQSSWNFIPPFVLSPSDPQVLYAGSRTVYKTTNRGSLWFPANGVASLNGTNVACIGVSWTSSDTLLAGTGSGAFGVTSLFQIFASANGGVTWTNVTGSLPNRYPTDLEFDPADSRRAYLTYSGYGTPHVYRTTNLGASWTDLSANLPDLPHQCIAVDPVYPDYLYVGTDLGVFQSSNGGTSWASYTDGMPDAMVLDLVVSRSNDALRAATFGNGVYQRGLPRFSALSLTYPIGNEVMVAGQVERIRWSQAYTSQVRIEFSSNAGADWTLVADSVPDLAGYFDGTVPSVDTDEGVVKVANVAGGSPADSGLAPFTIVVNPDLLEGWNMVSVPVRAGNLLKDSLFPTSISNAYEYSKGYALRDTLSNGKSFWLKFTGPGFTDLMGDEIYTDSVNLLPGWNMIGSISHPIAVGGIIERPPGLLTSLIYGYRKGYSIADSINPGRGYWVKAGSGGSLILTSVPFPGQAFTSERILPAGMNSVTLTDATGFSQTLYFSSAAPPDHGRTAELPPVAPGEAADVRFSSGGLAEFFGVDDRDTRVREINIQRLSAPVKLSWSVAGAHQGYRLLEGGRLIAELAGSGTTILGAAPTGMTLARDGAGADRLPARFSLEQNFPNPFNPSTTISYSLAGDARVRLSIHDNLGREVALLADGPEGAGIQSHQWNAASYASGIYFYRITVGGNSVTRKMLLIK